MKTDIDKLFKGYTLREIEEIIFRDRLNLDKSQRKTPFIMPDSKSFADKRRVVR